METRGRPKGGKNVMRSKEENDIKVDKLFKFAAVHYTDKTIVNLNNLLAME